MIYDPEYRKKEYERNKKKALETSRKYYQKNKERKKRVHHEYYLKNRYKLLESGKKYILENSEKRKEYEKEYRKNNKEKIKQRYEKNKDSILSKQRQYYTQNLDRIVQYRLEKIYPYRIILNSESRCNLCNIDERLLVHHKDRNHDNNDEKNLQIVCLSCHAKIHQKDFIHINGRYASKPLEIAMGR